MRLNCLVYTVLDAVPDSVFDEIRETVSHANGVEVGDFFIQHFKPEKIGTKTDADGKKTRVDWQWFTENLPA